MRLDLYSISPNAEAIVDAEERAASLIEFVFAS